MILVACDPGSRVICLAGRCVTELACVNALCVWVRNRRFGLSFVTSFVYFVEVLLVTVRRVKVVLYIL